MHVNNVLLQACAYHRGMLLLPTVYSYISSMHIRNNLSAQVEIYSIEANVRKTDNYVDLLFVHANISIQPFPLCCHITQDVNHSPCSV